MITIKHVGDEDQTVEDLIYCTIDVNDGILIFKQEWYGLEDIWARVDQEAKEFPVYRNTSRYIRLSEVIAVSIFHHEPHDTWGILIDYGRCDIQLYVDTQSEAQQAEQKLTEMIFNIKCPTNKI